MLVLGRLDMDFSRSDIGALDSRHPTFARCSVSELSIVTVSEGFMVSTITSQAPNSEKRH